MIVVMVIMLCCIFIPSLHVYGVGNDYINTYNGMSSVPAPGQSAMIKNDASGNIIFDTTGDLQIVKIYAKVYNASCHNRYTDISQISPMGQMSISGNHWWNVGLTHRVNIQNEQATTGYRIVAWQGSTAIEHDTPTHSKSISNELLLSDWVELREMGDGIDGMPLVSKFSRGYTTYNSNNYPLTGKIDLPSSIKTLYILYVRDEGNWNTINGESNLPGTCNADTRVNNRGARDIKLVDEDITDGASSIPSNYNIVKLYGKRDKLTNVIEPVIEYKREGVIPNVYISSDEPAYDVDHYWVTADASPISYNATQTPSNSLYEGDGGAVTINIEKVTHTNSGTLYIRYIQEDDNATNTKDDIIITESTIMKKVSFNDVGIEVDGSNILWNHNFVMHRPTVLDVLKSEGCNSIDDIYNYNWQWNDANISINLGELNHWKSDNYRDGLVNRFTSIGNGYGEVWDERYHFKIDEDYGMEECDININAFTYDAVVHRKDDIVTLANWKNNEKDSSGGYIDISRSTDGGQYSIENCAGILFEGNVIGGQVLDQDTIGRQRKVTNSKIQFMGDTEKNGVRYEIPLHFGFDTNQSHDLYREFETDHYIAQRTNDLIEESELDIKQGVRYYVYSGKADGGQMVYGETKEVKDGMRLGNTHSLSFTPYIQMKYDTGIHENREVYILGEYSREISLNSYVGVKLDGVVRDVSEVVNHNNSNVGEGGIIKLVSDQWNTHATSQLRLNPYDFCVLPGGAMLSLEIEKSSRRVVTVETIMPLLAGSGLRQVEVTGGLNDGIPTSIDDTEHKEIVKDIAESLDAINVRQYVDTEITDYNNNINIPSKPIYEIGQEVGMLGIPLSLDDKYKLKEDSDSHKQVGESAGDPANTADLDVRILEDKQEVKVYTFFTTIDGKIKCKIEDGSSTNLGDTSTGGEVVLDVAAGQTLSEIPDKYRQIEDAVGIIEVLYKGLEIGKGNDATADWATDGKWYNEAFDGISYVYMKTDIEVGFIDPYQRNFILDPKLSPISDTKGDMLTRYNASQFATDNYSLKYGKPGQLGEYKGIPIMVDPDKLGTLFISDIFFIPNMTVQDLK